MLGFHLDSNSPIFSQVTPRHWCTCPLEDHSADDEASDIGSIRVHVIDIFFPFFSTFSLSYPQACICESSQPLFM